MPEPKKPKEIKIEPDYYLSQFAYVPTKRVVYFLLPNEIMALCPSGTYGELFERKENNQDIEPSEMAVVTLVKHCNISKKDFDKAIKKDQEFYVLNGFDMMHEDNELPIADIIYTFDNEIINAYYRRENPIAPDWLGTERAKDYTYESYSEYLKANPQ